MQLDNGSKGKELGESANGIDASNKTVSGFPVSSSLVPFTHVLDIR